MHGSEYMNDETAKVCIEVFRKITGLDPSRARRLRCRTLKSCQIRSSSFDIDSLETMEFIMGVEERFNVQLDEQAVNGCANIAELVKFVAATRNV